MNRGAKEIECDFLTSCTDHTRHVAGASIEFCVERLSRLLRRLLVATVEQLQSTAAAAATAAAGGGHGKLHKREQKQQADVASSLALLRSLLQLLLAEPAFTYHHSHSPGTSAELPDAERSDTRWYPFPDVDTREYDVLRVANALCSCLQDSRFESVSWCECES